MSQVETMSGRNRIIGAFVMALVCPSLAMAKAKTHSTHRQDPDNTNISAQSSRRDSSYVEVRIINKTPERGPLALIHQNKSFSAAGAAAGSSSLSLTGGGYSLVCGDPCNRLIPPHELYYIDTVDSGTKRRLTATKPFTLSQFAGTIVEIEVEGPRPRLRYGGLALALAAPPVGIASALLFLATPDVNSRKQEATALTLAGLTLLVATAITIGGIKMMKKGRTKYKTQQIFRGGNAKKPGLVGVR